MATEAHGDMQVAGIWVEVVRKDIRNLHLSVHPPCGRVRVAAPLATSDEMVRLAVVGKLGWIRRQQARFAEQPRRPEPEMASGESHFFLGQRYRLQVHVQAGPARVALRGRTWMDLFVRPDMDREQREAVLLDWHRRELRLLAQRLLAQREADMGVRASFLGIRRMKTRWGCCNPRTGRIWLNLELAKKPLQCIEYVLVHELAHLLERRHDERFAALMDAHLPQWRISRKLLNSLPLDHAEWGCGAEAACHGSRCDDGSCAGGLGQLPHQGTCNLPTNLQPC